jgi:hypothetical protein
LVEQHRLQRPPSDDFILGKLTAKPSALRRRRAFPTIELRSRKLGGMRRLIRRLYLYLQSMGAGFDRKPVSREIFRPLEDASERIQKSSRQDTNVAAVQHHVKSRQVSPYTYASVSFFVSMM